MLSVALIWHMHQPYYRDLRVGGCPLPWVRLHAAKDYLHMGEVLARHPRVHATINMVPSLTEQMLDWAEGRAADDLAVIAEQETWTPADRRHILDLGFSVNWERIVRQYPRYAELLDRRPAALADPAAFTDADYRDLAAWFNLAWIDPNQLERDPQLAALIAKSRDFTAADLRLIHAKQRALAAEVLPLYRRLSAAGQLEVTASPYFHPILPLLVDSAAARRPSPGLPLPDPPLHAPEDAAAQLALAVEAHRRHFGAAPRGLWPSEGAVSPEILPLVAAAGFDWLATDEALLARSLGRSLDRDANHLLIDPRALYQPYRVLADGELGPVVIFRDHELSDRIGFTYQHLPGRQAAEDLIHRLLEIERRINDASRPYLVSIILDGENCWEHYEHNGDVFLDAFYDALSHRPELQAVTVSEFLAGRRPAATLARLATGSWIGGDLTTWIGDPEHNRAWEALARTRAHLIAAERAGGVERAGAAEPAGSPTAAAWRALYAAEGSDWFWWYSHRNTSQQDALFDRLFRHALAAVYEATAGVPGDGVPGDGAPGDGVPTAGVPSDGVPAWTAEPIYRAAVAGSFAPATAYITPRLTGGPYANEAWAGAAVLRPETASTGAMQRAGGLIERLFVGFGPAGGAARRLYLRLELRVPLDDYDVRVYLASRPGDDAADGDEAANQRPLEHYEQPLMPPPDFVATRRIDRAAHQPAPFLFVAEGRGTWSAAGPVEAAAGAQVWECSLPLASLTAEPGHASASGLRALLVLSRDGVAVAQLPEQGLAEVTVTPGG